MPNSSIWPINRTLSGATIPGQSRPGSDDNKGVLSIPKSLSLLEPYHQIIKCHIQDTRWGSLTPLQRSNRYIQQPQPTEFLLISVLPKQRHWYHFCTNPKFLSLIKLLSWYHFQYIYWPVGWGCRIHRMLLCRRVRPHPNECSGYNY